jgi:hypothetical protein
VAVLALMIRTLSPASVWETTSSRLPEDIPIVMKRNSNLSRQKDCSMLAADLMPLRVSWDEMTLEKVIHGAPDKERLQKVLEHIDKD